MRRSEWRSYDQTMIYHIGIIDFLQSWTLAKKAENYYKVKMKFQNQIKVSCASPSIYRNRFLNFITNEMLNKHKRDSRKLNQHQFSQDFDKLFDYDHFMEAYYNKYYLEQVKFNQELSKIQIIMQQQDTSMEQQEIPDVLSSSQFINLKANINQSISFDLNETHSSMPWLQKSMATYMPNKGDMQLVLCTNCNQN